MKGPAVAMGREEDHLGGAAGIDGVPSRSTSQPEGLEAATSLGGLETMIWKAEKMSLPSISVMEASMVVVLVEGTVALWGWRGDSFWAWGNERALRARVVGESMVGEDAGLDVEACYARYRKEKYLLNKTEIHVWAS